MKHIYTSVDIGSTSIKVIVCELHKNKLNLLAASSVKSKGIKKGLINDPKEAAMSLRKAFLEVEAILGVKIKKALVSVPSYFADFRPFKEELEVKTEGNLVDSNTVVRLLKKVVDAKITNNTEMAAIFPVDFKLDDKEGIKDPKGLVGSNLGVRGVIALTPRKNVYSVVNLLEAIGVETVDISLNCVGDVYAFKSKDIDSKIGAIVNIGSDATSVTLYNKGIVVRSSILQLGGRNIDNDIAYIYKVDLDTAVRLKEKFAVAHKNAASVGEVMEVTTSNGENMKINQYEVSEVAMSRIEEILNLIDKEIKILTTKHIDYIIITGGVSNMAGFSRVAEEVLGPTATVGNVKLLGIRNNKYSSAVGNIIYFVNKLKLKGQNYTMFTEEEIDDISSVTDNTVSVSNESVLGKIFGYFFNE